MIIFHQDPTNNNKQEKVTMMDGAATNPTAFIINSNSATVHQHTIIEKDNIAVECVVTNGQLTFIQKLKVLSFYYHR